MQLNESSENWSEWKDFGKPSYTVADIGTLYKEMSDFRSRINKLEKHFSELKPEKEQEWPQEGDEYWVLYSDGKVETSKWIDSDRQRANKSQGIYRTREAAEMEALRRECRASRPKMDWKSGNPTLIWYVNRDGRLMKDYTCDTCYDTIDSGLYGRTEEEARERWQKYGKAFEYLVKGK